MSLEPDAPLAVERLSKIDRARVPALIAQYLPVEICIYYQVVPIATDADALILGMVDPEDLAALDYVGKMVAYSQFKIQPYPLTFQQQQDLIAYYFSHPPDPAEIAALKASTSRTKAAPTPASPPPARTEPEPEPPPTSASATQEHAVPQGTQPESPTPAADEGSDETVQQLLNSMLRRALDEAADQIFVEPNQNGTCRVRYRQQGIIRDLFKELSDSVRAKLLLSMKRMVTLDPQVIGEHQTAEVERVYRGEALVLQLRVIPQRSKEGAILNILRGDSLAKYQQNQNAVRVTEAITAAQQAQQSLQQLQMVLGATVEKLKQYPSAPNSDWQILTTTLEEIQAQTQLIESYHRDWQDLQQP